jgi:hypothetical protein
VALRFREPRIITRGAYTVVGAWHPYEGDDEGPGWAGADAAFGSLSDWVSHRADDLMLGFLYRPHRDDPAIAEEVHACFVGVEVTSLEGQPDRLANQPDRLAVTRFSGGDYVLVDCIGDTPAEAAEGVGQAIGMLMDWLPAHGYVEGDACFAAGRAGAPTPPWVETVYIKAEKASRK